jgi:hypothetical protein
MGLRAMPAELRASAASLKPGDKNNASRGAVKIALAKIATWS